MDGFLLKGKKRYHWSLPLSPQDDGQFEKYGSMYGYKKPADKGEGKKPAESVPLLNCFVDVPDSAASATLKPQFNIGPIAQGKDCHNFVVDTGAGAEGDLEHWAAGLRQVVERVCGHGRYSCRLLTLPLHSCCILLLEKRVPQQTNRVAPTAQVNSEASWARSVRTQLQVRKVAVGGTVVS
eukprot:SAG22_NODE_635_length_8370_cov_33.081127_11_plen_181_part_00